MSWCEDGAEENVPSSTDSFTCSQLNHIILTNNCGESLDQPGVAAYRGPHRFKEAAMAKTVAFPIAPWVHFGDPRALLAGLFIVLGLALQLLRVRSSEPAPR